MLARLILKQPPAGQQQVMALLRKDTAFWDQDRLMAPEIDAAERIVEEAGLVELDPANAIARAEGGMWVMGWFYVPCENPASQAQCLAPDCSQPPSAGANWRGYCDECSLGLGYGAVRLAFEPQKWQSGYAFPADPRGPVEWEVPRSVFLERFPDTLAFVKNDWERDELRRCGNFPAWIADWSGPFEVRLADDQPSPWNNLK